jgi:beta-lactamase superfamily II metal-dependent hydrolase
MQEIRNLKKDSTNALDTLEHIRNTYTNEVVDWAPPYQYEVFSLAQEELKRAGFPVQTNHLSQIIFIKYGTTVFCIPGDLEEKSWDLMLNNQKVQNWLGITNILVASHHGWKNSYNKKIFIL